ncbi:MAG: hypothetical protein IPJ98_22855 [Bryobacterales bacterium]|nr:hypothetical protein [Bryobacterales bacterium]
MRSLIALLCLSTLTSFGQSNSAAARVYDRDGWTIPGRQIASTRKPTKAEVVTMGGQKVVVTHFDELPIWDSRRKDYHSAEITFVHIIDGVPHLFRQRLVAGQLQHYSVGAREFLYIVSAHPCSVDAFTKHGGCVGADYRLAFYDVSGDGVFRLMEMVPTDLSTQQAREWRPLLPEWVRGKGAATPLPSPKAAK